MYSRLVWTILFFLLSVTAPRAAAFCDSLDVGNAGDLSGHYERTDWIINDAPVYRAFNDTVEDDSEWAMFFIYRHKVAFTATGFVWALQPVYPVPATWKAATYGDGARPESAVWVDGATVKCGEAFPDPGTETILLPRGTGTTLDLMVLYTLSAARAAKTACPQSAVLDDNKIRYDTFEDPIPSCGIRKRIQDRIDTFQQALWRSGVRDVVVRVVHVGGTIYNEQPALDRVAGLPSKNRAIDQLGGLADELASDPWKADQSVTYATDFERHQDLIDYLDEEADLRTKFHRAEIHARRKAYGADMVHLVIDPRQYFTVCGIGLDAFGMEFLPEKAFSVTKANCTSPHRSADMSHELGHNFGLEHDAATQLAGKKAGPDREALRAVLNGKTVLGYVDVPNKFITIMSYLTACQSTHAKCRSEPYFENPDIMLPGTQIPVGSQQAAGAKKLPRRIRVVAGATAEPLSGQAVIWPPKVDWGHVGPGMTREQMIYIYNTSGSPLRVTKAQGKVTGISRGRDLVTLVSASGQNVKGNCFDGLQLEAGERCYSLVKLSAAELNRRTTQGPKSFRFQMEWTYRLLDGGNSFGQSLFSEIDFVDDQ